MRKKHEMPPKRAPPESWVEKQVDSGMSAESINELWENGLTALQRMNVRRNIKRRLQTRAAAQLSVKSGKATSRTLNFLEKGGIRRYATREEADAGNDAYRMEFNSKLSEKRLLCDLKNKTGCVEPGCVFSITGDLNS